ncbi:putative signal peptide protein (plasmid) [Nostoc sp. HK-01]|nr:putative signal peptide protein [Nostoc sp. HK-01]
MKRKTESSWTIANLFFACGISVLSAKLVTAAVTYNVWPNNTTVVTADGSNQFGGNLSGLFYEPTTGTQQAVLWGVQNSPSKLYNLVWNGSNFIKNTANGWSSGKTLRYPNGTGAPDAEGVTKAELSSTTIYVSTERDGSGSNRFSVLSYDISSSATTLNATREWNLTSNLPTVKSTNLGLEAIAWVPDSYLQANGFIDESTNQPYNPANYPLHGTGLFFVGLEANGQIYAYALNSDSTYRRIATIASGNAQIMDLSFDRDNQTLWAYCDNNCNNRSTLLSIDTTVGSPTKGKFIINKGYERPSSMPNINNEGIAIAPNSECTNNLKQFFWADDSETNGHALRRGTIPCGRLF